MKRVGHSAGAKVRGISTLKDAIAALERMRPLEGRDPVIRMMRAHSAPREPALAEKKYRGVVEGSARTPS